MLEFLLFFIVGCLLWQEMIALIVFGSVGLLLVLVIGSVTGYPTATIIVTFLFVSLVIYHQMHGTGPCPPDPAALRHAEINAEIARNNARMDALDEEGYRRDKEGPDALEPWDLKRQYPNQYARDHAARCSDDNATTPAIPTPYANDARI
jgi:hypothetical protein